MSEHLVRHVLAENMPRIRGLQIDPDKIGALIGPGGKNIRRITNLRCSN